MTSLRKGLTPFLCLLLLLTGASPSHAGGASDPLAAALAAERLRPRAPLLDRTDFLSRSNLADVRLSPDGRRVAFLRRGAGDTGLWILDSAGGAPRRLLRHSEAQRL